MEKKLVEEIDRVIGQDRSPQLTDKQDMPYAAAVQLELLRFISHAPLAVPHSTMCDVTLKGYRIPKDTTVS